jgi:methionyl-tRNA synthetase
MKRALFGSEHDASTQDGHVSRNLSEIRITFLNSLHMADPLLTSSPHRLMMTSALPYANGPIHIGHVAGAYLPGDIRARYERLAGNDVLWVCGSDEHGAAITLRAKKDGLTPRDIVDRYHGEMQSAFEGLDLSFDHYSRTSSPKHHQNAQDFFKTLLDKGSFEVKTEAQFYDPEAQQFLADRYIVGTCPKCTADGAYGDQCEKCGSALSPSDLIQPKSTLSGAIPILKDTTLWYLPMGRHEEWLRDYIEKGLFEGQPHHDPRTWKAHVTGQCRSWIDGGLQSRAMTRDLDWGVSVPVEGAEGKVLYVWLDAPIGYITATMEWAEKNGKDWRDWWQSKDAELVHYIGKDNIVFHCLIFPILLREHGGYNLPTNVPANAFMNLEGDKISTSRNWAVWVSEYLEQFPGKSDEMRYVLASIMPEQKDSEFTWTDYRDRINNELADVLGNFINRVVVLTQKYYQGQVPVALVSAGETADNAIIEALQMAPERIGALIQRNRFREALHEAMGVARLGNKYMTEQEPWKVQKTNPERTAVILHHCIQVAGICSVVLEPFIPRTAKKIQGAFGVENATWSTAAADMIPAGRTLNPLPILFEKVEESVVQAQLEKLQASRAKTEPTVQPIKEEMTFDDFQKLDLRVGEVIACERVPKANKLLNLTIRTGLDERTVLSGIAEHFEPEQVVGRRVTVLVNLAPRTMRGIESQGMVLMAETADGGLRFITPEEGTAAGDVIS